MTQSTFDSLVEYMESLKGNQSEEYYRTEAYRFLCNQIDDLRTEVYRFICNE